MRRTRASFRRRLTWPAALIVVSCLVTFWLCGAFPSEAQETVRPETRPGQEVARQGAEQRPEQSPPPAVSGPEETEGAPARQGTFQGEVDVTVVRVNVVALDSEGAPVTDLEAGQLEVLEDGSPVQVLGLEPSFLALAGASSSTSGTRREPPQLKATPWEIVVYVCPELAGRFQLPDLLRRVGEEARKLIELGPVDIVLADPEPWLVVDGVTDPADLDTALDTIASHTLGQSKIELIRQRLMKGFRPGVGFDVDYQISQESPRMRAARARAAARQELRLIQTNLDRLTRWVQSRPPTRRGLLVWVTGGFELNPAEFYIPFVAQVDPYFGRSMRMEYAAKGLDNEIKQVIEVAMGHGWTVMPVQSEQPTTFLFGADISGTGRVEHYTGVESADIASQASSFQTDSPTYPLALVAEATGGELVRHFEYLEGAIDRVQSAYFLSYQVDRPADGRIHLLQIGCSRPGVELHFARAVASGTLAGVAAARGQRLLQGSDDAGLDSPGTMQVSARLDGVRKSDGHTQIASLEVTAALGDAADLLAASGKGAMRVSIIVQIENRAPFVHHEEMPLVRTGEGDLWRFTTNLKWPESAAELAVVAEELSTGIWGATTLDLPSP